jgi:hypothetical protein
MARHGSPRLKMWFWKLAVWLSIPPFFFFAVLVAFGCDKPSATGSSHPISRKAAMLGANSGTRPAYELPPEEWINKLKAWTESHAALNLPLLSDDDISRESIYPTAGTSTRVHSIPAVFVLITVFPINSRSLGAVVMPRQEMKRCAMPV